MAIDISRDELIAITSVPSYLKQRAGKKPHLASIYRWINTGLRGVKLETISVGGSRFTSVAALNRFFCQTDKAKQKRYPTNENPSRGNLARLKEIEREALELGI